MIRCKTGLIDIVRSIEKYQNQNNNSKIDGKLRLARKTLEEAIAILVSDNTESVPLDFEHFCKTGEKIPKYR